MKYLNSLFGVMVAAGTVVVGLSSANAAEELADGCLSVDVTPALLAGQLDAVIRTLDDAVFVARYRNNAWEKWEFLQQGVTADPVVEADLYTHVFVSGSSRELVSVSLNDWVRDNRPEYPHLSVESLGGTVTSPPSVVFAQDQLSAFIRGSDDALWHKRRLGNQGDQWENWESLGGELASDPVAVSTGTGKVDVFARKSNDRLFHAAFSAGSWSESQELDVAITSAPSLVALPSGTIQALFRGADNALHWGTYAKGRFTDRGRVKGIDAFVGTPKLVARNETVDAFVRDDIGNLWNLTFETGWIVRPEPIATDVTGDPAAVATGSRIDIFTITTEDLVLTHRFITL